MLAPWKKSYDKPREQIKKHRHHFANKGPYSQSYGFSSSHIWMWELDHKEGWAQKNWSFWIAVLEKTLESPLDRKEIKPVNPKGSHPWILIGRTDAEAESPILWPPDMKDWLIEKDPVAGKDRAGGEWMTEDVMVGWNHWLNGQELEKTLGDSGSLTCCSSWGHRVGLDLAAEQCCFGDKNKWADKIKKIYNLEIFHRKVTYFIYDNNYLSNCTFPIKNMEAKWHRRAFVRFRKERIIKMGFYKQKK